MSKLEEKLSRLHASRVRALDGDGPASGRVFVAQDDAPAAELDGVAAPGGAVDSEAREAVRRQLEIAERLERRTRPRTVASATDEPPPTQPPSLQVGERLAELRIRAEALIGVGGVESALALLHEMAALSPAHPFPLTHLADYWRRMGHDTLANLYADRLAAIAPY